ncbi:hypothetical protein Q9292_00770 [Methylophilus sp. VKM B-3414]|uniref:hypothetical protein n=1 Tax=Methylophilus sp. VKM B-3414 TaxID=3076121 RepID=UPI0028CA73E7|nr:hypothetical protein [Methylophilus sp. VKM B-3414]MDT7848123.1 hypothetical protein [Methylophilus sp. VKM B-3414]
MSLDDTISNLYKAHQAGQEKYTYFLLAAAGAAIGFAVQKTEGLTLSWWLLPVALAIICWGISFHFGCKNVIWVQTSLMANFNLLQLHQGSHPDQPPHPQFVLAAIQGVESALEKNVNKAQFYGIWQFRLLVAGAVFFIVWRVTEMVRIS